MDYSDFVIITALDEEREALLALLPASQRLPPESGEIRVYWHCRLPVLLPNSSEARYDIVVTSLPNMGRVKAANATNDAVRRWQPRYVLLVGIAGGIAEQGIVLGDILISDQVVDYELQKITPNRPEIRYQVHQVDPALLNAAHGFADESWLEHVKTKRPGKGKPQRRFGPIATGDKVVAWSKVLRQYQSAWPRLIGVEMEAGGAASAALESANRPGFFMIRGVSDLADSKKDSKRVHRWRSYACEIAAAYAVEFLRSGPVAAADRPQLLRSTAAAPRLTASNRRVWSPAVLYPLQPAPHFAGREETLADLANWARDASAPVRVLALVAAGGVGKTAIAERVLASMDGPNSFGVFVWSFYENRQTETFLRTACKYFADEEPKETSGLLERLQRALTGTEPQFLILDGLERIQALGGTGRPRGELEDPLVRRLLCWLAAGLSTHAKALITSRFPLPDLHDWIDNRFREVHLEDLPPEAAIGVLRGWGVKGTDAKLLEALYSLQDEQTKQIHALSVSVLGSYLGKLWHGDVTKAPTFDREVFAAADPKAAKLNRILISYAEDLPAADRDLLARLSMFPRGVTVDILGYLVDAGGEVAGQLVGCDQVCLLQLLESLRDLGLVFRYETNEGPTFTAHPFLRDFFGKLHGVRDPKQIYEAVRAKLAPSLQQKPGEWPGDPEDLDRYERLIEVVRFAGDIARAFKLYRDRLGGYQNLGVRLGENARGLRIVSGFATDCTPATAARNLGGDIIWCSGLLVDWALFSKNMGDLTTAREALEVWIKWMPPIRPYTNLSTVWQSLADLELSSGHWPAAQRAASSALAYAMQEKHDPFRMFSHTFVSSACFGLGRLAEAREHFRAARELNNRPQLYSLQGLHEAEFKLAIGARHDARVQTEANQVISRLYDWTRNEAMCHALLGHCTLPDDCAEAHKHLVAARAYATHTGDIEVTLRCHKLAAEVACHAHNYPEAVAEALSGIQLADCSAFGRWSIDIRLALARVHSAAGSPDEALAPAAEALEMSEHPDCQYAWGIADALHLLGVTHARLAGKAPDPALAKEHRSKARDYLQRAVDKRKSLEHADLKDSETELARLSARRQNHP